MYPWFFLDVFILSVSSVAERVEFGVISVLWLLVIG